MPRTSKRIAFVTGIAGFAGSFLAEELLTAGYRVHGAVMPGESLANLAAIKSDLTLDRLDITKPKPCQTLLKKIKPHCVFHLAAFASVGKSFQDERAVFRVNVEGTLNMLLAARELSRLERFMFVSSPDCYGLFSPKTKTLTEKDPLAPVSPYGISKAAAEQLCRLYFGKYGLPVVIARAFNHSGPRQSPDFVVPAFARQIALIEANQQRPSISVGNLTARRDISDVRDIVRGYRLLVEKGQPGTICQLCSGKAVTMQAILDQLLKLSSKKISVRIDKKRLRKADLPVLRGSNAKAVKEIGFRSRYSLKTTLSDTLDYWRGQVAKK
jgi:GDP-4-dehydro-6-deoxy-D-mannose reductase